MVYAILIIIIVIYQKMKLLQIYIIKLKDKFCDIKLANNGFARHPDNAELYLNNIYLLCTYRGTRVELNMFLY